MTKSERLRRKLVAELESKEAIRTKAVRDAFLAVPREIFIPEITDLTRVYADEAFATKHDATGMAISSSSQPAIMAQMLEGLALEPGHRVLEIGAGTGYNAALIKEMVGDRRRVTTVDIDPEIASRARAALRANGTSVAVRTADGRKNAPGTGSFDRIVVTASSAEIPRAWFDRLVLGGRLVVPLRVTASGFSPQVVPVFERTSDGFESIEVIPGGFMSLRDDASSDGRSFPYMYVGESVADAVWSARLTGDALPLLSRADRRRLLSALAKGPTRSTVARGRATRCGGLQLYVAIGAPQRQLVESSGWWTVGLVDPSGAGAALLVAHGETWSRDSTSVTLSIATYGTRRAERDLLRLVEQWRALGRPESSALNIRVGYGRRRNRAWRSVRRGESVLSFDWEPRTA